jgi:hypothetical protein
LIPPVLAATYGVRAMLTNTDLAAL